MKFPRWELRHTADPLDTRAYKGGDGGAGQMRADEQARQAQVQAAVDTINKRFGIGSDYLARKRNEQYTDITEAVRDTALRDLDRQYSTASNRNTFGLANSGLLGGSVDAESGAQLQEIYGEGRMKATQAGNQAAADLRSVDEKTRQNLISLAQSGLDTGTASSMAAGQMAAAADSARSAAATTTVGRLFDDLSQAYVTNQLARARYQTQGPSPQQNASYGYGGFGANRYTGTVQR